MSERRRRIDSVRVGRLSQHQLDGTRRSVHACTRCIGAPTSDRVHCVLPSGRWARKDGRLRGAAGRGLENGKNQGGARPRPKGGTKCLGGPRQLTTAGRKSFYVFISNDWLPSFLSTFQRADRRRNNAHSTPRSPSPNR